MGLTLPSALARWGPCCIPIPPPVLPSQAWEHTCLLGDAGVAKPCWKCQELRGHSTAPHPLLSVYGGHTAGLSPSWLHTGLGQVAKCSRDCQGNGALCRRPRHPASLCYLCTSPLPGLPHTYPQPRPKMALCLGRPHPSLQGCISGCRPGTNFPLEFPQAVPGNG